MVVVVEKNNIEIVNIVVVYGNGEREKFGTRLVFREGSRRVTCSSRAVRGSPHNRVHVQDRGELAGRESPGSRVRGTLSCR